VVAVVKVGFYVRLSTAFPRHYLAGVAFSEVFISRASAAYGSSDCRKRNTFNRSKWSVRPSCSNWFAQFFHDSIEQ
jgi:hypothetical protein